MTSQTSLCVRGDAPKKRSPPNMYVEHTWHEELSAKTDDSRFDACAVCDTNAPSDVTLSVTPTLLSNDEN